MKIKFVSNYDNDFNIYKSIINCFCSSKEDIDMLTFEEDYDYLGVLNGTRQKPNIKRENIFGFLQEPVGNINYDRNLHFYCSKIFCQSKEMFNSYKGIIESPLQMFYSNHVITNKNFFQDLSFEKNKNLCIFISSINNPNNANWINHNYHKRIKFLSKILESDLEIDIFGRGLNIKDIRYKGSPENKHEILKKYKFSIAIENCCEKNYVSEKFFDCILNNTIPLYYGCPNVDEIFGEDTHIKINIEDNDIIDKIKCIVNPEINYEKNILEAKNNYFYKLNPLLKIKEYIKNV